MNIGLRIKELRLIHNLSSKQLAKLINSSQSVISKLENNNRIPDVPTLEKICKVFNISPFEFSYLIKQNVAYPYSLKPVSTKL